MRKADFEPVLQEDIKESQPWFKKILEPLNRVFEYVKEAFDGNISLGNLKVQVMDYSFLSPFAQTSFNKTRNGKVAAVIIANVRPDIAAILGPAFWEDQNDQIVITSLPGTGVGVNFTIRFLVFYE